MENPLAIINQMRRKCKVNLFQYTNDDALIDLNARKDELWSAICANVPESYNWERWKVSETTTDTEYTIPEVAFNKAWTKILKWISINYNWETLKETWLLIYNKAREVNPNTLEHEWNYYIENQPESNPIYFISDNSYFIAPSFRISWLVNRIKLTGLRKIPDYELTTSEADMKLPVDQQQVLVYWILIDWHFNKWDNENTINNAEARWERKKLAAIKNLAPRLDEPVFFTYPEEGREEEVIL